jgi:hypothetical protein
MSQSEVGSQRQCKITKYLRIQNDQFARRTKVLTVTTMGRVAHSSINGCSTAVDVTERRPWVWPSVGKEALELKCGRSASTSPLQPPLLGEGETRAPIITRRYHRIPTHPVIAPPAWPTNCPHHHTEECVVCWRRSLFSPAARLQAQSSSARRSGASVSTLARLFARTHSSHWASSASL